MKNLVIVESPTKAKTISRFLGSDFVVESSYGHIRDLPQSNLGVDVENNFEPHYVISRKVSATVKRLKTESSKAKTIILATDEDREGEAIAWHLVQALGLNAKQIPNSKFQIPKIERIVFHEITKGAIEEALKNPREIDMKRVDAQQARRILDRLVGYKLSPFLWKKVYRGLSAGRVQSVAVRLTVDREREIQNFKPEEYYTISAILRKLETTTHSPQVAGQISNEFEATLSKIDEKTLEKFDIKTKNEADLIVKNLEEARWRVTLVEKKALTKNPLPPFTTSSLQQDAFRRLGFSAKKTMVIAQQLYEGIELGDEGSTGFITYMRTDSLNLAEESMKEARGFIRKELGEKYVLPSPRRFRAKTKGAQEAHEAIRPTNPHRTPDSVKQFLDTAQFKLYDLVWRRFIATQMPQAVFDTTSVDIEASKTANHKSQITNHKQASNETYTFRATGQVMKFDGFLKIYPLKFGETTLPPLVPDEEVEPKELKPIQHFTQPPPRYNEASLIKILEQHGIGRPSTYAPTISTIQERGYVERFEKRYLKPTETGFVVNDLLVEHFPEVVDPGFTAKLEEELDEIAVGEKEWQPVIREFYQPFSKRLEEKYQEVKKRFVEEETNEVCEKCGKSMVVKRSRFGKFLACSAFPECRNTKTLKEEPKKLGVQCPKCQEGEIVLRQTRKKRIFYGCSRYPECDYATWVDPRKNKTP